jgi:hypothetical protein
MRDCKVCGQPIHPERLEVLPHTDTCTAHSTVKASIGFMVPTAAKGCAPVLHVVPDNKEALRQAQRANRRHR